MSQTPTNGKSTPGASGGGGGAADASRGNGDSASPAPQYYDLSAPLTRPVTALQVTGFTLREGMLPSLIVPDGSLYFGPIAEDGKYRIPSGCGIIFFHYDESVPPNFVHPGATASDASTGGFASYFFSRGVPREDRSTGGDGQQQQLQQQQPAPGQAAAAFAALCKRYQPGDRYGGDWDRGLFHGEGVLVTSYFTYQGGWTGGLMHGKGTISYTRKYVDARPAAGGSNSSGGVGTLLLKGLSYVTPFELVASAAAPKEYFGTFHAQHGRHGTGLMRYYNGDVYEGDWQDNCRHGKGKLRKLDGEIYEGDWANDERQGYGKIMYPNGSLFKGLMEHDQRNGEGVMRFANGDEYFGNFVTDRIEGHGTMRYRNGDVYEGAWHDQLRHGTGKFTLKRTGATMTGTFQNGLIHGEGTVVVPGVSTFVGTFVRGERTVGTMHWHPPSQSEIDGKEAPPTAGAEVTAAAHSPASDAPLAAASTASLSSTTSTPSPTSASLQKSSAAVAARKHYRCYQGEWHGDHMHGRGLLWYTNGDFFAGRFQKSLRHGPGNMRYAAEQAEFSGNFVHGVRHGLGLLQRVDGSIRAGRWQLNTFVEGYEGEWNGAAFHGIGRLTIPIDMFFGQRACNSTLKLSDVSAILNDTSTPPPPPPPGNHTAEDESRNNNNNNGVRRAEGVSPTGRAPQSTSTLVSDAMRRADLAPHFIDFFGLFRDGLRDGLGLLKLPALDCLVGGTLTLTEDRRGATTAMVSSNSNCSATTPTSGNSGAAAGAANVGKGKSSSANATPLPNNSSSSGGGTTASAMVPSVVIKGRWVREVLHCDKGVLAFPNGIVYIGSFHNGVRDAACARVWWPDGSVMESGWRDDAPSGPGVWYKRNLMDPIFQTIIPSTLRRSRSRRITDTHTATAAGGSPPAVRDDNSSIAGDLFGLAHLWGLVGLGFGGWSSDGGADEVDDDVDDEGGKPRRVLIDFHCHYTVASAWNPFPMDSNTYARVVLPQIAARTAPLVNGTPWPMLLHSASMVTALSNAAASWDFTASPSAGSFTSGSLAGTHYSAAAQQQQQQQQIAQYPSPTVRQIVTGATALHLAEAPPKISVGRANGATVVYFESGVVLAGEWLSNVPRLAVPYRPWSAYDSFLVWQASRPAARNCVSVFPLWVSPRSQSCYTAVLAAAPDDVRGEPKRAITGAAVPLAASLALSPLTTSGGNGGEEGSTGSAKAAAAEGGVSAVTSPDTRCTVCGKEYSFFRKRVHCTLCLRSTCSSCLGLMDTDGQRQEDVKALLQHAYVTSELTMQLATAAAKSNNKNNNNGTGTGTARHVVFPSITVEQVEHAFDAKGLATVPVCADCVRAVLWKLRYTQLWIPTSMFASVVDMDQHQRDAQTRRKAGTQASAAPEKNTAEVAAGPVDAPVPAAAPAATGTADMETASPISPGEEPNCESSRQTSDASELLPVSATATAPPAPPAEKAVPGEEPDKDAVHTPSSHRQKPDTDASDASPAPNPPSLPAETAVAVDGGSGGDVLSPPAAATASGTSNRYARVVQDPPRPTGELLLPTQYITYSGYTSHSIPHIYGELWWGRRYYYRGGFCAGERHGFGVQYMPNGERYEGAFQRDAWHGQGVYYLEDGSVLLGEFCRGELQIAQYHGEVEENTVSGVRPHGRGVGYDPDGAVYNGEWVHGQRHGTGMLHLPDGVSVYSGTFVANAMEGMGKLVTTSGAYYGDFSHNQQQGKGLLFTSSCVVEGSWVNGASSGFTRIFETTTGEVYETTYRDGNERDDCFSTPVIVDDAEAAECGQCGTTFSFFLRRHHCRLCGDVFCDACSQHRATLPANFAGDGDTGAGAEGLNAPINPNTIGQRVCDACFYRLTQRRMIALRRYTDGSIYAGCWSQGRWVSRGLYCRPDGIFIVMDTRGVPLISADLARAKMMTSTTAANTSGSPSDAAANSEEEQGKKKLTTTVPPGGLGVPRRPARAMLPISPSILQDATPAKEVLDNAAVITESSSRRDLDTFLMWWATTRSRCGLQVPLDVLLVSKYQRMPAQLLRGGKSATVALGSDAATYLACPTRCTVATPSTPSLMPIRLFVTLADSRKAMRAMVDGEMPATPSPRPTSGTPACVDPSDNDASQEMPTGEGGSTTNSSNSGTVENSHVSTPAAAGTTSTAPSVSGSPAPRLTTEEHRVIDNDVEAAALRASRFMPVAIPRAPTVPITAATAPTTSIAAAVDASPTSSSSPTAQDLDRAVDEQPLPSVGFSASPSAGGGSSLNRSSVAVADVEGSSVFGLTAWATRTPPSIANEDITDEQLMTMMRAERLAWTNNNSNGTSAMSSLVEPLMPPTPSPPRLGENTAIAWDAWTTREIPHYAPPPLIPVMPDGDGDNSIRKAPATSAPTASSSTPAPPPPPQPRSEADLYFACPFWEPTVPDAQMLLEQGKLTQATRLMRRLQRQHQTSNAHGDGTTANNNNEDEEGVGNAWVDGDSPSSSPNSPAGGKGKKNGNPDTLDVLQQMQAASGTGTDESWAAGGLLSAEQRAQSGGGWAPAPMQGPFVFDISASEKKRSSDGQRWCFKVHQREISGFQ